MEVKDTLKLTGRIIIRSHPAGTIERYFALKNDGKLAEAQALVRSGKIEIEQKNLVVASLNYGFDIIVQYLISAYTGSFAFPHGIAWGEIGTGTTTPAISDTALTTPTARTSVSYAADLGFNEAQLQFFFPDNFLPNGTYYEFGTFVGGTSTIGSGNMFNHALFSVPYSKSNGVDTSCEVDFVFSS